MLRDMEENGQSSGYTCVCDNCSCLHELNVPQKRETQNCFSHDYSKPFCFAFSVPSAFRKRVNIYHSFILTVILTLLLTEFAQCAPHTGNYRVAKELYAQREELMVVSFLKKT